MDELNALDGKGTARQLIESGSGTVTPYGVVYDNGMKLEQVYDGRFFPCYYYEPNAITVVVTSKAELEAERPDTLRGAYELLRNLDNYQRITEDAYGYGQQRLQETLGLDDEAIYELEGYMDFEKYGQDCMENDCVMQTEFGLLRRLDPPFPEPRQGQRMM